MHVPTVKTWKLNEQNEKFINTPGKWKIKNKAGTNEFLLIERNFLTVENLFEIICEVF